MAVKPPHIYPLKPSRLPSLFSSRFVSLDEEASVSVLGVHTPCGGMFNRNCFKTVGWGKISKIWPRKHFQAARRLIWVYRILAHCTSLLANCANKRQTSLSGSATLLFVPAVPTNNTPLAFISVLSGTIHFKAQIKVCCIKRSVVVCRVRGVRGGFDSQRPFTEVCRGDDCGLTYCISNM